MNRYQKYNRTEKGRRRANKYNVSDKGRARGRRYSRSDKGRRRDTRQTTPFGELYNDIERRREDAYVRALKAEGVI